VLTKDAVVHALCGVCRTNALHKSAVEVTRLASKGVKELLRVLLCHAAALRLLDWPTAHLGGRHSFREAGRLFHSARKERELRHQQHLAAALYHLQLPTPLV